MSARQDISAPSMAQAVRVFIATFDVRDARDREVAFRIRERLHGELYRREREIYPEYVDHGGEA